QCSSGSIRAADIDDSRFAAATQLAGVPDADLMIRTGGEQRISNFLLWHAAYAELFFTPVLWPEFGVTDFEAALAFF
ncbi:undecaprenyl diphosphate synthase family protein, partial [Acinetobacter baumannii]